MPIIAPLAKRFAEIGASAQMHRDIDDDRYRELRRPRRVRFFVNGDRYFKGKRLFITPNRYFNFNDLLNDLTNKLPQNVYLPYGVRQIFTPVVGEHISDIVQLQDGSSYICAGFEMFKPIKYGNLEMEPWSIARPHEQVNLDLNKNSDASSDNHTSYNAFHPGRYFHGSHQQRKPLGTLSVSNRASNVLHSDNASRRPKVITIVRHGSRPRNNIKILLNRQSVQSFEQLLADIAESFGTKWQNNKLRRLYTLRGKQVQGISDFFREDDVFIAVGKEQISENEIQDIIQELYPNSPYAKSVFKQWEKTKRKRLAYDNKFESEKLDSGFGSSESGKKDIENEFSPTYKSPYNNAPELVNKGNLTKDFRMGLRIDRERDRVAYEERVRARKRQKKLMEAERQNIETDRLRLSKFPNKKPLIVEDKETKPMEGRLDFEQDVEKEPPKKCYDNKKLAKDTTDLDTQPKNKTEKASRNNVTLLVPFESVQANKAKLSRSKLGYQVTNEDILERYSLGRTLGYGNFAEVREAKLKQNMGCELAMKIIDKHKLMGKEHMVESEIIILNICKHNNIVKLYEEFETSDRIYLTMELVKGGDLFDAITQSVKFGEKEAAGMVQDLCNALFYLHSMRIVHRDLKPENLLVHWNKDGSMTLKLADFGLAMEVTEDIYTVCGTPTYVAPEILAQKGYGLEVDMWAIGVISFILLCGFPPFHSHDRRQSELFESIKAGEYEFLSPYWDTISKYAKALIKHLLVVDRKRRYTASDVLSHPWILCGGDTVQILHGQELADAQRQVQQQLNIDGKKSFETFQKLKEQKM